MSPRHTGCVGDGVPVRERDGGAVTDAEPVRLARLCDALTDALPDDVREGDVLPVALPVTLLVVLPVALREGVAERVPVADAEIVALRVVLPVALREGVTIALPVRAALPDAVGVGRGEGSDAMLSPRYVSRAMAAASCSHSAEESTPLAMLLLGTSCVTLASR